jgi:hypothetical protein
MSSSSSSRPKSSATADAQKRTKVVEEDSDDSDFLQVVNEGESKARAMVVLERQGQVKYQVPESLDEDSLYKEFARKDDEKGYKCPLCSFSGTGSRGRILEHASKSHLTVSGWGEMARLAISHHAKGNKVDLLAKLGGAKHAAHPIKSSLKMQNGAVLELEKSIADAVILGGLPLSVGETEWFRNVGEAFVKFGS